MNFHTDESLAASMSGREEVEDTQMGEEGDLGDMIVDSPVSIGDHHTTVAGSAVSISSPTAYASGASFQMSDDLPDRNEIFGPDSAEAVEGRSFIGSSYVDKGSTGADDGVGEDEKWEEDIRARLLAAMKADMAKKHTKRASRKIPDNAQPPGRDSSAVLAGPTRTGPYPRSAVNASWDAVPPPTTSKPGASSDNEAKIPDEAVAYSNKNLGLGPTGGNRVEITFYSDLDGRNQVGQHVATGRKKAAEFLGWRGGSINRALIPGTRALPRGERFFAVQKGGEYLMTYGDLTQAKSDYGREKPQFAKKSTGPITLCYGGGSQSDKEEPEIYLYVPWPHDTRTVTPERIEQMAKNRNKRYQMKFNPPSWFDQTVDPALRESQLPMTQESEEQDDEWDAMLGNVAADMGIAQERGRWVSEDKDSLGPVQQMLEAAAQEGGSQSSAFQTSADVVMTDGPEPKTVAKFWSAQYGGERPKKPRA